MKEGDEGMKKIIKSYSEDGVKYWFDCNKMQMYANQMKNGLQMRGKKMTKDTIMKEMADKLFVSYEAIKSWMYGTNGPSDLEQIKQVADYFGVEYHQLLDKEEEEMATKGAVNMMVGMASEEQAKFTKEKVREIYGALIDYINAIFDYYYTENPDKDGDPFNPEYKSRQASAYTIAIMHRRNVDRVLEKDMLDIPKKLYDQVHTYLWSEAQSVLEEVIDSFEPEDEEDPDYAPEDALIRADELTGYRNGGYIARLREIFADYIVK